jgi:hypothetical protein
MDGNIELSTFEIEVMYIKSYFREICRKKEAEGKQRPSP